MTDLTRRSLFRAGGLLLTSVAVSAYAPKKKRAPLPTSGFGIDPFGTAPFGG